MTPKLTLNRETLRLLDAAGMQGVLGAELVLEQTTLPTTPLTLGCLTRTCPSDVPHSCPCTSVQTSITHQPKTRIAL